MHGNETTALEYMTLMQSYTTYVTRKTRKSVESHQTLFLAGTREGLGPRLPQLLSVMASNPGSEHWYTPLHCLGSCLVGGREGLRFPLSCLGIWFIVALSLYHVYYN